MLYTQRTDLYRKNIESIATRPPTESFDAVSVSLNEVAQLCIACIMHDWSLGGQLKSNRTLNGQLKLRRQQCSQTELKEGEVRCFQSKCDALGMTRSP